MDLHLIRHGQSEWHLENRYAGHTEIALTEIGKRQSQDLAMWAGSMQFCALFSSNAIRARQTIKPLTEQCKLSAEEDERLKEVNFGLIEGLNPEEMRTRYPGIYSSFLEKPADTVMPKGESGKMALERAWSAVCEIVQQHESGNVLVVTHGTLMRLIACRFLGIDLNEYRRVFPMVPNTGRMLFRINGKLGLKAKEKPTVSLIKFDEPGNLALNKVTSITNSKQ